MAKYLDSKGLSYLWQKIKAELALKSDNHEHPYLGWASDIKQEDKGKVVVFGTPEYDEDNNLISQPTVVGNLLGRDVASTSIFADETYVILDGVGSNSEGVSTKIPLKKITETVTEINDEGKEIKVQKQFNVWDIPATSGLELTYTDGEGEGFEGKKVIKLTDTNNPNLDFQLDATPFIKDGVLESVQILKWTVTETTQGEGEEAVTETTKAWKTLKGVEVKTEDLIDLPQSPADDSIWMYFVWKTVHHDPSDVDTVLETKTASWLPATDLIKDCSGDPERGIAADTNEDGGHKFYVKTTGIEKDKTANVSTGFDKDGNVVGYVDLSEYQKSEDLVAFDKDDLNAIFDAAEKDLAENGTPTFPTADPLAKEEASEQPEEPTV